MAKGPFPHEDSVGLETVCSSPDDTTNSEPELESEAARKARLGRNIRACAQVLGAFFVCFNIWSVLSPTVTVNLPPVHVLTDSYLKGTKFRFWVVPELLRSHLYPVFLIILDFLGRHFPVMADDCVRSHIRAAF